MASYNPQGPDELEELMGVPLRGAKDSSTPGSDNTGPTPQKRKNPPTSGNVRYDPVQAGPYALTRMLGEGSQATKSRREQGRLRYESPPQRHLRGDCGGVW